MFLINVCAVLLFIGVPLAVYFIIGRVQIPARERMAVAGMDWRDCAWTIARGGSFLAAHQPSTRIPDEAASHLRPNRESGKPRRG